MRESVVQIQFGEMVSQLSVTGFKIIRPTNIYPLLIDAEDDEPVQPDLRILNTNLIGVVYTAKLAVHYLSRNTLGSDRCLIMTASLAGYLDQPGSPQYCGAKWGVRGLMRSLRRTCPKYDMRVNIIAPWFIKTQIISEQVADVLMSKGIVFAEKEDAGKAVLHLASDRSFNGEFTAGRVFIPCSLG